MLKFFFKRPDTLLREMPHRVYYICWQRQLLSLTIELVFSVMMGWYYFQGGGSMDRFQTLSLGFMVVTYPLLCLAIAWRYISDPLVAAFYEDRVYIRCAGILPKNKIKEMRFEPKIFKFMPIALMSRGRLKLVAETEEERKSAKKQKIKDGTYNYTTVAAPFISIEDDQKIKNLITGLRQYRS